MRGNASNLGPHLLWITLWASLFPGQIVHTCGSIYQTAYFLGVRTVLEEPQLIVAHIILSGIFTHF
jgi:energy-converting hydrogenase Eha subunit F